jgi:hypothetical protein
MSEIQIVQLRDDMTDDQAMGQAEAFDARARDEAEMVERIEGMDTIDLTMVSGKALEARVHNWGDLAHVNLAANPRTLAYVEVADGFEMTMTAGLELVFKDMAKVEVDVLVTARRDDGIFGFRGVEIIPA